MSRYKSPIRTPQEWQHIVQDFYRSGRSSSEFCKLHDINIKTFGNNRRKFSHLIEPPTEAPFIEVSKPDTEEHPEPTKDTQPGRRQKARRTGPRILVVILQMTDMWLRHGHVGLSIAAVAVTHVELVLAVAVAAVAVVVTHVVRNGIVW